MTREKYVKWCEKCVNREYSMEGLLCGLTHAFATFKSNCFDFQIDKKEGFLVDQKFILNKYGNNFNSEIKVTSLHPSLEWIRKLNMPEQLVIRNESKRPWFILILVVFSGYLVITTDLYFFQNSTNNIVLIFIMLSIAMIVFSIFQFINYKQDETPVLTLSNLGIKIGSKHEFQWDYIQTFHFMEGGGKNQQDTLIIKPLMQNELKIRISKLEYSPKKIIHIIEKYKLLKEQKQDQFLFLNKEDFFKD